MVKQQVTRMQETRKQDIQGIVEIRRFVDLFYSRIQEDPMLGPVFDRVSAVNWEQHLDTMYRFWDSVLFGSGTYKGNPLLAHQQVNDKVRIDRQGGAGLGHPEFDRWLEMFHQTMDDLFSGPRVELAKRAAGRMASHLQTTLADGDRPNPLNLVPPSVGAESTGSPGNLRN